MLEIVRSSDADFSGLSDFPFQPHYFEQDGLRTHYVDEGPRGGKVALFIHGEPTWSYLYRRMISPMVEAGYRCIAPDHIGFGRSDKVVQDSWYVIDRHIERLKALIEHLDLDQITLFVQDWGGPIGLVSATESSVRFEQLVIMNTWLHHDEYEYSAAIRYWRDAATHPFWLAWTKGDLPVGAIVQSALTNANDEAAIRAAYEAPYVAGRRAKAGARRFPWCIPFAEPDAGAAHRQAKAYAALKSWSKRAHLIFGELDPIFPPNAGAQWASQIPGATFHTVNGGHFLQEDCGPEIVELFLDL